MRAPAWAGTGWLSNSSLSGCVERLPGISQGLASVTENDLHLWILGILHRQRERGGLYHPYMDSYARQNYWGKHPFGRVVADRETYPSAGRYRPRLIVTDRDRYHDNYLAPSAPGPAGTMAARLGQTGAWGPAFLIRSLIDLITSVA